jgi:hypothetical protein
MCETTDRIIGVVHGECDTGSPEIVDVHNCRFATISRCIYELELSWTGGKEVGSPILSTFESGKGKYSRSRAHLIAEGVSSDYDRLGPPRYWPWNLLQYYWFSENRTIEDISGSCKWGADQNFDSYLPNGSIRGFPHALGWNQRKKLEMRERNQRTLRLNSFTRASSGVIVAHFTPTEYLRMASADSTVTVSPVASRCSRPRS